MLSYTIKVEYAHDRKIRTRNKAIYRVAHWPIWIWVFFLAPGPLTFDLFAHGPGGSNLLWLLLVLLGTGIAGTFGQLPGVEPRPYILRFNEDRPNPLSPPLHRHGARADSFEVGARRRLTSKTHK